MAGTLVYDGASRKFTNWLNVCGQIRKSLSYQQRRNFIVHRGFSVEIRNISMMRIAVNILILLISSIVFVSCQSNDSESKYQNFLR